MNYRILFLVITVLLVVSLAYADVPKLINFQGRLTDSSGKFVPDGNYSVTFRIYTVSSGGTARWTEVRTVSVTKGLFNIILGENTSIPDSIFNYTNTWLGIQVASDPEMAPRQRISSSGYSYKSLESDTANYARAAMADGDWTISGNDIYRLNGNVGIGTTIPEEKLDVAGTSDPTIQVTNTGNSVKTGIQSWSGGGWIGTLTNHPLRIATNGTWRVVLDTSGNVGIGTTSPERDLDIFAENPNLRLTGTSGGPTITLDKPSGGYWEYLEFRESGASKWQAGVTSGNNFYILNWPASQYVFYANSSGDVGIGTTSPSYKLDVNGDINVSGSYNIKKGGIDYTHPDYVFEPDYKLMSLEELKKYVFEHKSLPNVISADDVSKNNGFKMDELLVQMLEKIEEQTLYIFQLEERIIELEKHLQ